VDYKINIIRKHILEEMRVVCDCINDWILSRLGHMRLLQCLVIVDKSFIVFTFVCRGITSSTRFGNVAANKSPTTEST
jgi:hypothetical protein